MVYSNDDFIKVIGKISIFFATLDFFVSELIICILAKKVAPDAPPFSDKTTLGQKLRILESIHP